QNLEIIIDKFSSDQIKGLTQEEAEQRLESYGPNQYEEEKKETLFQKIWHHLTDISTIILLIAACISAYTAIAVPDSTGLPKTIVILSIVVLNLFLGISQE